MKTLNLTKEQAVQYYNNSNDNGFKDLLEQTFGKDFAKPQEIWKKVKDLNGLIDHLGYNPLVYSNPSNSFEKYINACSLLAKLAEVYNEGTVLNWKNTNEYKYLPYKYFRGGSVSVSAAYPWVTTCRASARLYYKNSNLSIQSYNNFKKYWEDFWSN